MLRRSPSRAPIRLPRSRIRTSGPVRSRDFRVAPAPAVAPAGLRRTAGPDARREPLEHASRKPAADSCEPGRLDDERRLGLLTGGRQHEVHVDSVSGQLERDVSRRFHLEHEQVSGRLRPAQEARPVAAANAPARSRYEAVSGVDLDDVRPPGGEALGVCDDRPCRLDRRPERAASRVPWQGTRCRRASARAPPSARRRRAARSGCASGRRASSRRGSAGRRAPRSAAGA